MMELDPFTVNVFVAVATLAAGVMYLLETMLRRETRTGQIWALAYLCGMLTVVAYLVWKASPDPLIAIAIGNAALVATIGCLWLGCVRYNGRSLRIPAGIVTGGSAVVLAASMIDGMIFDAGDWAGSIPLFIGVSVGALLGAIESRWGNMNATLSTVGLTIVLVVVAAYYGARAVLFALEGSESELFTGLFGSSVTGIITVILMIVALVTTTTLRNNALAFGDDGDERTLELHGDSLLTRRSFVSVMNRLLARDREQGRSLGVIAFRLDDLPQIGIAFGAAEQEAITALCRSAVRRYAPSMSPVGEYGLTSIVVTIEAESTSDVRRAAGLIQRRMLDDLAERGSAVIPVIGVGVAMEDRSGTTEVRGLLRSAFEAAGRASTSSDVSVMIAD